MSDDRVPPTEDSIEIDTRFAAERWNYICPRGHIHWQTTAEGFRCHICEKRDGDGWFPALFDRRAGERIPRERVRVTRTAVAVAYETDGGDPA